MHTMQAHSGMEVISHKDCLRLLARGRVGRLGFVAGDQPMILPVNYAIQDDVIVFRTNEGTKLESAPQAKVAFEVDEVDVEAGTGWSVVVQGVAAEITEADDWWSEALRGGAAPTFLAGPLTHYVRITPNVVSGRRLPGTALPLD